MPAVALGAHVTQLRSVATRLVAVRCAVQVHLSHNVLASGTHLRMEVYMCIRVMRSCTDFWRSGQPARRSTETIETALHDDEAVAVRGIH